MIFRRLYGIFGEKNEEDALCKITFISGSFLGQPKNKYWALGISSPTTSLYRSRPLEALFRPTFGPDLVDRLYLIFSRESTAKAMN